MSKFLNILVPAASGTALMLGLAYGVSSRSYGATEISMLEGRVADLSGHVEAASAKATETAAQIAALQTSLTEAQAATAAQADRATALETQIAAVQADAAARLASGSSSLTDPAPQATGTLGLGRAAHTEEIAAWDVDILPDGRGLPPGSGNAYDGEEIFANACGSCHGDFAEGVDNWPVLAGGFDTLADEDPVKTVGSYWPYLSTVWDYVNRSMPFGEAQSLSNDEVYAIVAYILYSNDMIDDDFELSAETFLDVEMYNADGFIVDDRPQTEYALMSAEPCMSNCKDSVEVTMRASRLNVTPMDDAMHPYMRGEFGEAEAAVVTDDAPAAEVVEAAADDTPVAEAAVDAELIARGERVYRKCQSCHQIGDGARNRTGPHLNDLIGRVIGGVDGFRYSNAMKAAGEEGRVWTVEELDGFLANPRGYMRGTKMSFSGLKSEEDRVAIAAYLGTFLAE